MTGLDLDMRSCPQLRKADEIHHLPRRSLVSSGHQSQQSFESGSTFAASEATACTRPAFPVSLADRQNVSHPFIDDVAFGKSLEGSAKPQIRKRSKGVNADAAGNVGSDDHTSKTSARSTQKNSRDETKIGSKDGQVEQYRNPDRTSTLRAKLKSSNRNTPLVIPAAHEVLQQRHGPLSSKQANDDRDESTINDVIIVSASGPSKNKIRQTSHGKGKRTNTPDMTTPPAQTKQSHEGTSRIAVNSSQVAQKRTSVAMGELDEEQLRKLRKTGPVIAVNNGRRSKVSAAAAAATSYPIRVAGSEI